jgi:hypothetical protein
MKQKEMSIERNDVKEDGIVKIKIHNEGENNEGQKEIKEGEKEEMRCKEMVGESVQLSKQESFSVVQQYMISRDSKTPSKLSFNDSYQSNALKLNLQIDKCL